MARLHPPIDRHVRGWRSLAAVALVAVVTASGAACSRGGDGEAATPTTSTTVAPPVLHFTVSGVESNGTAGPTDDVIKAITAVLDGYLAAAVVAPLHTGTAAGDLGGVLSADAIARLAADPPARASLVDEGLPKATSIVATRADVVLGTVAAADEVTALVGARIDLVVRATGPGLDVDIVRNGELVLAPEPEGWRIDSFVVRTTRDSRDA